MVWSRFLGSDLARVALRAIGRLRVRVVANCRRAGPLGARPSSWHACASLHTTQRPAAATRQQQGRAGQRDRPAPAAPHPPRLCLAGAPHSLEKCLPPLPAWTFPQKKEELDQDEEYAVERLCSFLARVQGAGDPLVDDSLLDETQREFLLSYRLPTCVEADSASSPGVAARQYILPHRNARGGGDGCGACSAEPSRASSEEAEPLNHADPELQELLRAVSQRRQQWAAGLATWRRAEGAPCPAHACTQACR